MENTCWTNASCNRALIVSHGGDWTVLYPYDSMPAFQRAYEDTADSVKGDFRVSSDNVGVVMHSSPIEFYESINCWGKRVENMTVSECTSCQMEVTDYHFISVPHLLAWANGKVITMLCVKRAQDIPRAISTLIENKANHRAFLEISLGDAWRIKNSTNYQQVYYLIEIGSAGEVEAFLSPQYAWLVPRVFAVEYNNGWRKWGINISESIARFHKRGVKTLVATEQQWYPSVAAQEAYFNDGFDIVYTYGTQNAVIARTNIDKQRGIVPP